MLAPSPSAARSQQAFKSPTSLSTLHEQHWWFSGKIGRCQPESLTSDDIGQPRVRFPADARTLSSSHSAFAFGVFVLLRLRPAGSIKKVIPIDFLDPPERY